MTTPQEASLSDCRKAVHFIQKVGLPILGVIENMSGPLCPHCGKQVAVFSEGGGEQMAEEMRLPFLGRIPLAFGIMQASDRGKPAFNPDAPKPVREAIEAVGHEVWARIDHIP